MKNEFRLENFETNEKVTVRLYEDCMDIIDKDGFKTTLFKDTITDANIEKETHSEHHDPGRIRVGARVAPGVYVSKSVDMSYDTSYTLVKLRIKSNVIDDLVLFGSEEDLKDILYYCVSKRRNLSKKEVRGYYAWLVVGYTTLAIWAFMAIMMIYELSLDLDAYKEFTRTATYDICGWLSIFAFLGLIPTYLLGFVYKDSKPEVKYPKKN